MTWRDIRRSLQNMEEGKLNGEALLYIPAAFNKEKGEVIALKGFTPIDGELAEEHDLTEGDPILLRY